jgi:hypothetical protein
MQTGNELVHDERLGEVVVGAFAETRNAIFQAAAARHDENGRYVSAQSQIAQELEAILVGKTQIENDRCVVESRDGSLGIDDLFRLISVEARSRQAFRDKTGKLFVVFNNENPHRPNIPMSAESVTAFFATNND